MEQEPLSVVALQLQSDHALAEVAADETAVLG